MLRRVAEVLACQACGCPLRPCTAGPEGVECSDCGATYALTGGVLDLRSAASSAPASGQAYARFVRQRRARGTVDSYAAFRPFNESSRLVDAFLPALVAHARKGGYWLDTWSRTPWMAAWLAGHAPDAQVIAVWEGDRGLLGRAGYEYWFSPARRPANLMIVFADLQGRWPFRDGAFDLVHALDTLHRYGPEHVWEQASRVARREAPILFPHVHLADHDPSPYFDRGCDIRPRRDYQALIEAEAPRSARNWFILPEASAFRALKARTPITAAKFAGADDYNACIVGLPQAAHASPPAVPIRDHHRALVSPLVDVVAGASRPRERPEFESLLARHPVYAEALQGRPTLDLSPDQRAILQLFADGLTASEVRARIGLDVHTFDALVGRLCDAEVLRLGPIHPSICDLHAFLCGHRDRRRAETFRELWGWLEELFEGRALVEYEDGSEFDVAACRFLTDCVQRFLVANSAPGDRILLCTPHRPEVHLLAWACLLQGRTLVCVDPGGPHAEREHIRTAIRPALVIGELEGADLTFDADASPGVLTFEAMIVAHQRGPTPAPEATEADDEALVLFTSGSTHAPKGVRLSQRSLLHSAYHLAQGLGWGPEDRLLASPSPHSMSGLRNPVVAALVAGVTTYVPAPGMGAASVAQRRAALATGRCTLATTVPAELDAWTQLEEPAAPRLRQIAVTGYACPPSLREQAQRSFACEVPTYYGLTESGGCCLVQHDEEGSLGSPVGSAIRVVGPDGDDAAEGELWVCSAGLMLGYLDLDTVGVTMERGWLLTGDRVRRLEDGSVDFVGRIDRQAKSDAGDRFDLSAIERFLSARPEVRSVRCKPRPPGWGYDLDVLTRDGANLSSQELRARLRAEFGPRRLPAEVHIRERDA